MATYSWADLINSAPEQEQAPLSLWDLARQKQQELGLTPGMEGTTTLYTGPQLPFGSPNMSLTPFDGAQAHTFYTPPEGAFVSPTEGMERLYRQALGGNVQEEYVNPAFSGATGRDTTNYDFLAGLDPYKKDWGLGDSAYFEQKSDDGFLGMLKEMAPGLAILGGGLGLVAGGPALFGGGAAAAAGGEAAAAAGTVPAWAPGTAGATFNTGMGILPSIMEAQTLAGAGLTAAEMVELGVSPLAAKVGSLGLAQMTGPNPKTSLLDVAKKIPTSIPGGGTGQIEGGGEGGDGMSIWSDTVTPYGFNPVNPYQPKYLDIQQQQFPFEAELAKRLALIRGAR